MKPTRDILIDDLIATKQAVSDTPRTDAVQHPFRPMRYQGWNSWRVEDAEQQEPEIETFDSGNLNVSVCTSLYAPTLPGHWVAETYIAHGLWLWVRVNGESQAMRDHLNRHSYRTNSNGRNDACL